VAREGRGEESRVRKAAALALRRSAP